MNIMNWYCKKCDKTVASVELDERNVHRVCNSKAEWVAQKMKTIEESQEHE